MVPPLAFTLSVPRIVEEAFNVSVSAVLIDARLLKIPPVIACAAVPATRIVPASGVSVPALTRSASRESVPDPPFRVAPAAFVKVPVEVAVPVPTS